MQNSRVSRPAHGRATLLPIRAHGANEADIGRDAGDSSAKEMIPAAAAQVERETALGKAAEKKEAHLYPWRKGAG